MSGSYSWKKIYEAGGLKELVDPVTKDTYVVEKFLGEGGFGAVFRAYSDKLGRDVALKIINIANKDDLETFDEEAVAYGELSRAPDCHMYIVCLYDAFILKVLEGGEETGYRIGVLIYELMAGDLEHVPPTDEEIPVLLNSVLEGLKYIHDSDYAHRDLKPGNILRSLPSDVNRNSSLFKIADLGLLCGRYAGAIPTCANFGTRVYDSPKYNRNFGRKNTIEDQKKEDIWQLFVTLYEVIFGQFPEIPPAGKTGPLSDRNWSPKNISVLTQDDIDNYVINEDTPYPLKEVPSISGADIIFLLTQMAKVDENERWTADELLNYFIEHSTDLDAGLQARTLLRDIGMLPAGAPIVNRSQGKATNNLLISSEKKPLVNKKSTLKQKVVPGSSKKIIPIAHQRLVSSKKQPITYQRPFSSKSKKFSAEEEEDYETVFQKSGKPPIRSEKIIEKTYSGPPFEEDVEDVSDSLRSRKHQDFLVPGRGASGYSEGQEVDISPEGEETVSKKHYDDKNLPIEDLEYLDDAENMLRTDLDIRKLLENLTSSEKQRLEDKLKYLSAIAV